MDDSDDRTYQATRTPLAVLGPLLFTLPVVALAASRSTRPRAAGRGQPNAPGE